jgi:hypothetical protein
VKAGNDIRAAGLGREAVESPLRLTETGPLFCSQKCIAATLRQKNVNPTAAAAMPQDLVGKSVPQTEP